MDKQELISIARQLIGDAETERAIELMETTLREDVKYRTLHREVVETASLYNQTRREVTRGVISFDNAQLNFNRVKDRLLDVLDNLEKGQLQGPASVVSERRERPPRRKWLWLLMLPVLAVVLFYLPGILRSESSAEGPPAPCPQFGPASLRVLVLPYVRINQETGMAGGLLAENIESFCRRCRLDVSVRLFRNFKTDELLAFDEAEKIAERCSADLIVWGRAEQTGSRNIVKTRFRYTGEPPADLPLAKLEWGEKQIDTLESLSLLASQQELTEDLNQVLLWAIGAGAAANEDPDNAACLLQKMAPTDSVASQFRSMLLADIFLKSNRPADALTVYDSLLVGDPSNWLALNNRGILLLQTGNYLQAINDFTEVLLKKEDGAVLMARAKAYEASGQLQKAGADFEKVIRVSPEKRPVAETELRKTNEKIRVQENLLQQMEPLQPNTSTTRYITQVEAWSQIGETQKAMQLVEKSLEINPADPRLIASKLELLLKEKQYPEADKVLAGAREAGVSDGELSRHSKVVAEYLKTLRVKPYYFTPKVIIRGNQ